MRIAAAQISCVLGDVPANLAKVAEFAARAKANGAELILFPEMTDTGYAMPVIRAHASEWNDGAVAQLRRIARAHFIAIICGVSERTHDCIYNSQVAIDARGEIISTYRKTHLFTPIEEHTCFSAGNDVSVFAVGEMRFGASICYDLRFPELYRRQAIADEANAFLISSAWPFPRVEHLRALALARAIENQSYVILSNRVGRDAGTTFCGSSVIIDPYGVILAAASSDREELVQAEISSKMAESVRARMPVFKDRREELYRANS